MDNNTIIISLGGSLVAPNEIDLGFLKLFKRCLQKYLGTKQFIILVGGGKIARNYQKALLEIGAKSNTRDWIGINVTKLNAEQVKMENAVAEKFKDLEFSPDFIELVISKAKNIFYERREVYESKRQGLINQKSAFEARLKVAETKLLSDTLNPGYQP